MTVSITFEMVEVSIVRQQLSGPRRVPFFRMEYTVIVLQKTGYIPVARQRGEWFGNDKGLF